MDNFRMPLIGEKAPAFKANSTFGPVNFPADYKGKWVVFFSHPGDFTPVCTTEIMTFASMKDEFAAKNAALLGLSVDSNPSHIEWVRVMSGYTWNGISHPQVSFPIIADDFGEVARMYGMLMPSASATKTVRNVYMIDPEGVVRAILVYPLTTGRNMYEIYRLLLALQAYDRTGNATPADWEPGGEQLKPVPQTVPMAVQRLEGQNAGGYRCLDWYICFTQPGGQPGTESAAANPAQMPAMQGNTVNGMQMPAAANMMPLPNASARPDYSNMPGMTPAQAPAASANIPVVNAPAGMNTAGANVRPDTSAYGDVLQSGRPFPPELMIAGGVLKSGTLPEAARTAEPAAPLPEKPAAVQEKTRPAPQPVKYSGILDENRSMMGKNTSLGNSNGMLGDYFITRDNRPKKNM